MDEAARWEVAEREHFGKVVSIDVNSGDYEVVRDDADEIPALRRIRARHNHPQVFGLRVGYRTVGRMGGAKWRLTEGEPTRPGRTAHAR